MSYATQPISSSARTAETGLWITRSGIVTPEVGFGELSKFIHTSSGGDLVFEYADGKAGVVLGLSPGSWVPVIATRVLTSATFGATTITTTASGLTWHGGF
jgi:hypothetical protein